MSRKGKRGKAKTSGLHDRLFLTRMVGVQNERMGKAILILKSHAIIEGERIRLALIALQEDTQ